MATHILDNKNNTKLYIFHEKTKTHRKFTEFCISSTITQEYIYNLPKINVLHIYVNLRFLRRHNMNITHL